MNGYNRLNVKGLSLLELLVALVIAAFALGGAYRLFALQGKAYTVQDQVVEVQQNIRSAMELLLNDLRMAGFDDDNLNSKIVISNPVVYPVKDRSITVSYEHVNCDCDQTHVPDRKQHTVAYWVDADARLIRQLTITPFGGMPTTTQEAVLENVEVLNFTYGIDRDALGNEDGAVDFWDSAGNVGSRRVVAVRVTLTARPAQMGAGDDRFKTVTPRTLNSIVTFRNLSCIS